MNLYGYAGGDPVNYADPFGLATCDDEDEDNCSRAQELANWGAKHGGFLGSVALNVGAGLEALAAVANTIASTECNEQGVCYGVAPAVVPGGSAVGAQGATVRSISGHARGQMAARGVSEKMIDVAVQRGSKFLDPKNGVFNFVLENGCASGKSLLVGQAPGSRTITTVIRGTKLVRPRFIHWNW